MVLTTRTYTTLFATTAASTATDRATPTTTALIRLPLSIVPQYEQRCEVTGAIVPTPHKPLFRNNLWSSDEHERFLHGLEMFPNGPWKEVARIVGTKTTRQTMTHAQKYRQKIERRLAAKPKSVHSKTSLSSKGVEKAAVHTKQYALYDSYGPFTYTSRSRGQQPHASLFFDAPNYTNGVAFDTSSLDSEFHYILNGVEPPFYGYD